MQAETQKCLEREKEAKDKLENEIKENWRKRRKESFNKEIRDMMAHRLN